MTYHIGPPHTVNPIPLSFGEAGRAREGDVSLHGDPQYVPASLDAFEREMDRDSENALRPSSTALESSYVSPGERTAIALEELKAALPLLERIAAALEAIAETVVPSTCRIDSETTSNLSPEHRERLAALADLLDRLPDFDDWRQIVEFATASFQAAIGGDGWSWLVGYGWRDTDDTLDGAAARIRYLLEHGLPEDWRDQMSGEAELCYEVRA